MYSPIKKYLIVGVTPRGDVCVKEVPDGPFFLPRNPPHWFFQGQIYVWGKERLWGFSPESRENPKGTYPFTTMAAFAKLGKFTIATNLDREYTQIRAIAESRAANVKLNLKRTRHLQPS